MSAPRRTHAARVAAAHAAIAAVVGSCEGAVTRAYARVRFLILRQPFLDEIGQYLPPRGRILDLGCGFGLFSLYYALLEKDRQLTGVDLDARRIAAARASAERLQIRNARYEVCDIRHWDSDERFDAVYMLDLVHHLPRAEVAAFFRRVRERIAPGGTLIVKDVSDRPAYKRWFTWLLDRLMVGLREPIRYWPPSELMDLLEELGFEVRRHQMNDVLPYPHILYVCRLRPGAEGGSAGR